MKTNRWLVAAVVLLSAALATETAVLVYWKTKKPDPRTVRQTEEGSASIPAPSGRRSWVPGGTFAPAQRDPFVWAGHGGWDPFEEMDRIQARMNRLLRESFSRGVSGGIPTDAEWMYEPEVEVDQTPDAYVLRLDLPGVDKGAIHVKVRQNVLTVSGQRRHEQEAGDPGTGSYRSESVFSSFHRSFPLPADADPDRLTADSKDGVLTVTLPRLRESATTGERRVPVR